MAGLLGMFTASGAAAGTWKEGEEFPVRFELVSEEEAIRPGQRFTVGLRLQHDPGWHTYWQNPGIVGVPTSIEWTLPEGFTAGPIQWPQPEVVKMAQLDAYGYENEAVLLVDLQAPPDLKAPADVILKAKVVYMACASSCHPGFKDMEMRVPVAVAGKPRVNEEMHRLFEESRATFAEAMEKGWKLDAWKEGEKVFLKVARPGDAKDVEMNRLAEQVYFFDLLGLVDSSVAQTVVEEGKDAFVMELTTATWGPKDAGYLEGILYSSSGWQEGQEEAGAVKVRVPLKERKD
jgi:DsbC/DsbD-like thiol-disulfide interchange protein